MRILTKKYTVRHPGGTYDIEFVVALMPRRARVKVAVKKKAK